MAAIVLDQGAMEPTEKSMEESSLIHGEDGDGGAEKAFKASARAKANVPAQSQNKEKVSSRTNRVRQTRIDQMMSKAELARRAGLSVLTIDRVEKGLGCRMDTKRKILEALGLSLADRVRVFGEEE